MTVALVSAGAVATGTSSSITNLAYGQTPTAGNVLVCWAVASRSSGTASITTPSGWTLINSVTSSSFTAAAFQKVAAGGDAAPTISASSATNMKAQLSEWSGVDTTTPVGSSGTASTTTGGSVTPTASAVAPNAGVAITVGGHKVSTAATTTHTPASGWTSLGSYVASNAVHAAADYDLTPDTANPVSEVFAFGSGTATTLGIVFALNAVPSVPTFSGSGSGRAPSATASGTGTNPSGPASYAFVQSNYAQSNSGTTLSVTLPNPVTPGNFLAAAVIFDGRSMVSGVSVTGVSDNLNGSGWDFTTLAANDGTNNTDVALAFFPNSAGGSCTVTMTISASSTGLTLAVAEYSGVAKTSPLDQSAPLVWSSGTATETITLPTLSGTGELVIGCASPGGVTPSAGTGYTARVALPVSGSGNNNSVLLEDAPNTSTTGVTVPMNMNAAGHHGSFVAAAFKLAPTGPTGSGTGRAPNATASGAGSLVIPSRTGSGSGVASSATASGSGTSTTGYHASGSGVAKNPTASGSGTFVTPSYSGSGTGRAKNPTASGTGTQAPASHVDHVFLIVMENKSYSEIVGSGSAPYINNTLIPSGFSLTNYFAETHPSLPNYLAILGGNTFGVTDDSNPPSHVQSTPSLFGRCQSQGVSWRSYCENYRGGTGQTTIIDGDSGSSTCGGSVGFMEHHMPAAYFSDVRNNTAACLNVQDFTNLAAAHDLSPTDASQTPKFVYIASDPCHDMHDGSVSAGDTWLQSMVQTIQLSKAWQTDRCVIVTVWDEDDSGGNNKVACVFNGSSGVINEGQTSATLHNHYDLTKTIEWMLGLNDLGQNDTTATVISEAFGTALPTDTGSGTGRAPQATAHGTGTFTVPSFTGSGTGRAKNPTATGTGTRGVPSYTGSGSSQSKNATASGTGTSSPPTVSGSGSGRAPGPHATGSGYLGTAQSHKGPVGVITTPITVAAPLQGNGKSGVVVNPSVSGHTTTKVTSAVTTSGKVVNSVTAQAEPQLGVITTKVALDQTLQGKVITGATVE